MGAGGTRRAVRRARLVTACPMDVTEDNSENCDAFKDTREGRRFSGLRADPELRRCQGGYTAAL